MCLVRILIDILRDSTNRQPIHPRYTLWRSGLRSWYSDRISMSSVRCRFWANVAVSNVAFSPLITARNTTDMSKGWKEIQYFPLRPVKQGRWELHTRLSWTEMAELNYSRFTNKKSLNSWWSVNTGGEGRGGPNNGTLSSEKIFSLFGVTWQQSSTLHHNGYRVRNRNPVESTNSPVAVVLTIKPD